MLANLAFRDCAKPPVSKQHVVIEFFGGLKLLDSGKFLANDIFITVLAEKIWFGEVFVVGQRVLRLDNDLSDPRRGLAWMKFRRSIEPRIFLPVLSDREGLN